MGRYYYDKRLKELSKGYNVVTMHPYDVRDIVETFEDLLSIETFDYSVYEGMRVLVLDECNIYELIAVDGEYRKADIGNAFFIEPYDKKKFWKRLTIETITTKEALQRAKNNLVNGALIYISKDIDKRDVLKFDGYFGEGTEVIVKNDLNTEGLPIGCFDGLVGAGAVFCYYSPGESREYLVKDVSDGKYNNDSDLNYIYENAEDGKRYLIVNGFLEPYEESDNSENIEQKAGLYFCEKGVLTMAGGGGDAVDRLNEILDASIAKLSIDSTNRQLKATSSDNKNFFVAMTELIKPASPSIATTEYAVVTGNADVTITNNQTGATLKYSTDGASWTNVSNDKVSLASGFETTNDNSTKTYTLRVKAVLNGVESDVVTETITINPKVSAPALVVSRTPNNNDWATMATITMTASSYKGATSKYSDDGGNSWYEFTGTKTFTTTANATASKYQVKAERTGYIGSDTLESTAITLNKKKFYYGRGPATLSSESNIKSLVGGGSIEKSTMAGSYSIKSTEMGQYTWFCGTGTLSNVTSGGFLVPFNSVQVIDGYNCYRSSSPVQNLESDTFVVS